MQVAIDRPARSYKPPLRNCPDAYGVHGRLQDRHALNWALPVLGHGSGGDCAVKIGHSSGRGWNDHAAIVIEHEKAKTRRQIAVPAFSIDGADQLRQGYLAFRCDLLESLPERNFET